MTFRWKRQFPPLAVPFYFLWSFCYSIISLSLFSFLGYYRFLFFSTFQRRIPLLNCQTWEPPKIHVSLQFFFPSVFNHCPFPIMVCWLFLYSNVLYSSVLSAADENTSSFTPVVLESFAELSFSTFFSVHTADR